MSIDLTITYKERYIVINANENTTVQAIKQQLQNHTKIPVIQQELSYKNAESKIILSDNQKSLKYIKIPGNLLSLKNLGRQIRWKNVFYIQYLGPVIIVPLFHKFGKRELYTPVQTTALTMAVLHYIKRQYQTAYVHVFSRQSMPFKRVLINSAHYWIFFGLLNAIQLYLFPSGHTYSKPIIALLIALWAFCEFMNYKCHKILGDFRKTPKAKDQKEYINPTKQRQIPYGYGFDQVSCANYFWQALGWIIYSLLTRNYTSYIFTVMSIVQMAKWAKQKHVRYIKQFKQAYPKRRKAMFPFIF